MTIHMCHVNRANKARKNSGKKNKIISSFDKCTVMKENRRGIQIHTTVSGMS